MNPAPGAPKYFEAPSYSASDIANGAARPETAAPQPTAGPIEAPPARSGPPRPRTLISDIAEEKPLPADTEDALLQGVNKAHRIVAGRIKYHEDMLRRWRAAASSFAGLSSGEGPAGAVPHDVAAEFLEIVRNLPEGAS